MNKFVIGSGGSNLPAKKSGGLTIGGKTSVAKTGGASNAGSALSTQLQQAQDRAAFRQKPLLVYLMVDLTGTREETRSVMRPHEESLAKLIMSAGGNHPVVCKGVFHKGGRASRPQLLENQEDIMRFFAQPAETGLTDIASALKQYGDDETKDVLSLGVLIGDDNDGHGDGVDVLTNLARQLKQKKRPLVIVHQETYNPDFCRHVAPAMAKAGEGLEFELGTQPKELHALLDNYRKILTATPDELKATAQGRNANGVTLSGSAATQIFSRQAATLLLTHDK